MHGMKISVWQPIEDKQRALDAPQLAQGHSQTVLTRIAAELPEHE